MGKKLIRVTGFLGALTIFTASFVGRASEEKSLTSNNEQKQITDQMKISYHLISPTMTIKLKNDFITLKALSHSIQEEILCTQIREYATFFRIDPLLAEEIARYYTNDFTDEDYLETFNIGPTVLMKKPRTFANAEAGIMAFIRCLYQTPNLYADAIKNMDLELFYSTQLDSEQRNELMPLFLGEDVQITRDLITTPEDMWLYEESGLTQKQFMGYVADVFETDPYFAAAINYAEMGVLRNNSGVPRKNNYGNYRKSPTELYSYPSIEAGIIEHVINTMLKKGDLSVVEYVTTKSGAYVHGPNSGIEREPLWEKNVLGSYKKIVEEEQETYTVPEGYRVGNSKEDKEQTNRLTFFKEM